MKQVNEVSLKVKKGATKKDVKTEEQWKTITKIKASKKDERSKKFAVIIMHNHYKYPMKFKE